VGLEDSVLMVEKHRFPQMPKSSFLAVSGAYSGDFRPKKAIFAPK
jgi:hypothetical protein